MKVITKPACRRRMGSVSSLLSLLTDPEIELPALQVDANDFHMDLVPQAVAPPRAPPGQAVRRLLVIVVVVVKGADVDQALDGELFRLGEEAIVGDAGDDRVQFQADA